MNISVICATYNRAELLDRALQTYALQIVNVDWEYLICDDMSTDNTKAVVEKWQKQGLPLRYFTADEVGYPKVPGLWRDGCTLRNAVSTFAFGRVLIGTHPEIMIPPNAIQAMYDTVISNPDRSWITAVPYWLPDQPLAEGWKEDIFQLTKTVGFYDPSWPEPIQGGVPDYRNQHEEVRATWDSEVFWAMKMSTWRWMGGFRNFTAWGSVDMDFLSRRWNCGIQTIIAKGSSVPSGNLMVFHQWHESKRDMDLAYRQLQGATYSGEDSARKAGGLYDVYNHGHRERAVDGRLGGILGDHLSRYEWAANYCAGKFVVDIPCGTGYGCHVITNSAAGPLEYLGVDIDQESIDFATQHYRKGNFRAGDMTDIPMADGQADIVVSFEGLEHIDDKAAFVREIYRILKPGGTFIISTPQKGAARGTPWDRYIISADEFIALFSEDQWTRLDWFHMMSYGSPSTPLVGKPPKIAEIMILGGTKIHRL